MSNIERITVAVPVPMAESMRAAVDAGEYATTSEVVRDALRLWEAHRVTQAERLATLQRAWKEGIESGPAGPLDLASIKARGRARLAARSKRG